MRRLVAALTLGMCLAVSAAISGQTRGVTAEDYLSFEFLADPHFAPDGSTIAFVVTTIDRKQNRRHSDIWTVAADGSSPPAQLTRASQSSSSPRWSPDGRRIAFLSARAAAGEAGEAGRSQVWLLSMSGGEARRLTSLTHGVSSFAWSPDGTRLVCVSRSGPGDSAKSPSDVRHYKHLNYKFNDTGWFDDTRAHLWVVNASSGAATQITSGDDWNDADPQWSPDGQTIAFIGATEERGHPKIWLAPAAGGGQPRQAIDGLDLIPAALRWAQSGDALYFEAGVKGATHLFRADLAARRASAITSGERTVHLFDINEKMGRITYAVNDPTRLDDLYAADLSGRGEKQLMRLNVALWKDLRFAPVERVPFKGADGWDVDGFLMKPIGWEAGRKYPMVLTIHGGPAGMFGFDWYHEFQVYAARGWAVFFTNPRGSTGYGEKFERGVQLEWGGKAYVDIMNGVDAVLAKYPWIDGSRLGVTGGSYGGFMTNWIISHTDRFKAAVTLRSISNFVSDDGTRDGAYGHSADFGGDIFQAYDNYWNYSPLKYVKNVKTPTLVLHSDIDFRVPIEQGEQWFRALQHFGVPSEIVFFPRENHNLTRTGEPKHLVESINWQVYWFDRYLNGNSNAVPPDAPEKRVTSQD